MRSFAAQPRPPEEGGTRAALHVRMTVLGVGLAVAVLAVVAGLTLAQTGGGYDLTWSTVDGGGATFSIGEGFSLGGTAGQPDAGLVEGGAYALAGGFWPGGAALPMGYVVYLPLVVRGY